MRCPITFSGTRQPVALTSPNKSAYKNEQKIGKLKIIKLSKTYYFISYDWRTNFLLQTQRDAQNENKIWGLIIAKACG